MNQTQAISAAVKFTIDYKWTANVDIDSKARLNKQFGQMWSVINRRLSSSEPVIQFKRIF